MYLFYKLSYLKMNPMDEEIHALFDGIYHAEKECFFCKEFCKNKCAIECIHTEAARRRIILLVNDSSLSSVTNAMRVFLKLILYGILEGQTKKISDLCIYNLSDETWSHLVYDERYEKSDKEIDRRMRGDDANFSRKYLPKYSFFGTFAIYFLAIGE
jgi:hypothetical protein